MVKFLFLPTVLRSQGRGNLSNWKQIGRLHSIVVSSGLTKATPATLNFFGAQFLVTQFCSKVPQIVGASSSSNHPGHDCRTKTGRGMSEKEAEKKEEKANILSGKGPQGAKVLATQVGGHQYGKNGAKMGMLDRGNGLVMKALQPPPRGTRELWLYQTTFAPACQDKHLLELRQFLPLYYGTEVLDDVTFLVMNNIAHSFAKPNVLDLKMGLVSSDPEATEEKRRYEELKYPPRKQLGFQLTGMMVHDTRSDSPQHLTKAFCRSISADAMLTKGLGKFFGMESGHLRKDVVLAVLDKLRRVERWFEDQCTFAFYSSSLLIIYGSHDHPPASSNPSCDINHAATVGTSDSNSSQHQDPVPPSLVSQPIPSRAERYEENLNSDQAREVACNSRSSSAADITQDRSELVGSGRPGGKFRAGQKRAYREEEECPLTESASQCKLSKTHLVEEDAKKNGEKAGASNTNNVQSDYSEEVHVSAQETEQYHTASSHSKAQTGLSESKKVASGTEGKACISETKEGAAPLSDQSMANKEGLGACRSDPSLVEVRMIDFAHVFPATGKDTNYLFGLQKLISLLEQLLKM